MNTTTLATADDALARAIVYRTLSIGFQAPTADRLDGVGARDGFPVVITALRHLVRSYGDATLDTVAERLASVVPGDEDTLAASFARLFGHTARGPVCACETEYGDDNAFHQPQQLADISGYYLAFGLRPFVASEARVDHIACELEFMDFLSRKEALLAASEDLESTLDLETADATRSAERAFMRDHLARFGRAFATRLVTKEPDGYFGILGHLLLALLSAECERLGVEGGPVDLAVRPEMVDDTPMACGSGDQLIQIQRRP